MVNTQYENLKNVATARQSINSLNDTGKSATNSEKSSMTERINADTFELCSAESAMTYSPSSVTKSNISVNRASSSQSTATTDFQLRNIPLLLATKMAGLSTNADGTPKINNNGEYQRLLAAQNIIAGDHAKLSVNSSYCYSQNGYSYGNPCPKKSCCVFSFATALSIKYGKQITPANIKRKNEGWIDDLTHYTPSGSASSDILEWKYDSDGNGSYDGTAYRIYCSSGSETLKGIDAQLQLGNPVLIHATGRNAAGAQSEHWATVIGKESGRYKIIDPWDGSECWLEDMEIYKNGGSIQDYVILSNKY